MDLFMALVTKNQKVTKMDQNRFLEFNTTNENYDEILTYLKSNGYNYTNIEEISKIGQGGEA
jgi:serine/threonine protein kinase